MPFTGLSPVCPCPTTGHRIQDTSHHRCVEEGPPPSTCWQHFYCSSPQACWPSLPQGHIAGSWSTCCSLDSQVHFCKAIFYPASMQPLPIHGLLHPRCRTLHCLCHFVEVSQHIFPLCWGIFSTLITPPHLLSVINLPRVYSIPLLLH